LKQTYETQTKNLIQYAGNYYTNLEGTSKFSGIELSYQNYIDALDTNLALNYAQGSAKDSQNQWLARRAESTANIALNYEGFDQVRLGLNTRYIGKKYDKSNQQGANIGDYFVTDLNINYELTDNTNIYLNVLNAFDEDYTHAVGTYESDGVTPKTVYSNGGRQFFVGIRGQL